MYGNQWGELRFWTWTVSVHMQYVVYEKLAYILLFLIFDVLHKMNRGVFRPVQAITNSKSATLFHPGRHLRVGIWRRLHFQISQVLVIVNNSSEWQCHLTRCCWILTDDLFISWCNNLLHSIDVLELWKSISLLFRCFF